MGRRIDQAYTSDDSALLGTRNEGVVIARGQATAHRQPLAAKQQVDLHQVNRLVEQLRPFLQVLAVTQP